MNDLTLVAARGIALPAKPFQARHLIGGAWQGSADDQAGGLPPPGPPASICTTMMWQGQAWRRRW
jgi:hypothetical protein